MTSACIWEATLGATNLMRLMRTTTSQLQPHLSQYPTATLSDDFMLSRTKGAVPMFVKDARIVGD